MTEFKDMTLEEKRVYAAEQVAYWRAIQRDLDRHETALTSEEKTAIDARITTEAAKLEVVVKDAEPIKDVEVK